MKKKAITHRLTTRQRTKAPTKNIPAGLSLRFNSLQTLARREAA
jgi:hypothetical protein